jgi:3-oxoadipate enol-lactonase
LIDAAAKSSIELHRCANCHAPTIALLPGLDGTALLFYRQIPLLRRSFHVLTIPLPDSASCTMSDLVSYVCDAVDRRAPSDVIVCGESFGGALALSVALRSPAWLAGLVVVNSFSRVPRQLRLRLGVHLLRLFPWAAMPLARRFTAARLHSRHAQADDLREFHARSRFIGRTGYLRRLQILRSFDVRGSLCEIRVPTLLLAADQDRLLPSVSEGRFMARQIPAATLQILDGYGHICLINHDLDLHARIAPWFEKTGPRASRPRIADPQ